MIGMDLLLWKRVYMGNNILEIKQLCVDFLTEDKSTNAVIDFSLSIKNDEILGLVGESGSGKSTVIKSILRILPAPGVITNGEIIFQNKNLLDYNESDLSSIRWSKISLVKQKALNSLNPLLTIQDQIIDTIKAHETVSHKDAINRCQYLMDLVEIDKFYLKSYPHELSGGMRQRVVIAIALALKPKLIIMDEPTTALDVIIEKEIILKILELKAKLKFSLLFITHDLNLILSFADRIGVMQSGKLIDLEKATKIKSEGTNSYTKKLIDSIPNLKKIKKKPIISEHSNLIIIKNLLKTFEQNSLLLKSDKIIAVNNVSFNINKNEIVGLVGESGSGKSTISKILTKLIDYDKGEIIFNDKLISDIRSKDDLLSFRKNIQMIFQDPFASLNSIHTVFHHLSRPILIHNSFKNMSNDEIKASVKEKILKILSEVGLNPPKDFLYRFPHEMSGGERQRISLARALLVEPKVIIADEPTSMLDMSIRMEILDLFKELQIKKGISILFITHDIASACYISDRLIVLKNGEIVDSGNSEDIINNPKHNYSKLLIKSSQPNWFRK